MFNRPRKLELDYLVPRRRARWPGALLLAVSLALGAGLFERWREAQLELARLETMAGMSGPARAPLKMPNERLDDEVRNAEAVVRSLTLPWAGLVHAIEQSAMRDVALLQLQPDAQARLLKLTAEARTREAMFDYVRRLGAAKGVHDVHLVSHQVSRDDPQRPVQFSVQAVFK